MSKQTQILSFTELSANLIADKTGSLRQRLLDEINPAVAAKEAAIAKGLSPEAKTIADAEHKALKAAARIIDLFWHATHNNPTQET
jgi:hypothetical protein